MDKNRGGGWTCGTRKYAKKNDIFICFLYILGSVGGEGSEDINFHGLKPRVHFFSLSNNKGELKGKRDRG